MGLCPCQIEGGKKPLSVAYFFKRGIGIGEQAFEGRIRDNEPFARFVARYPFEFLAQMLVAASTAHQPSFFHIR